MRFNTLNEWLEWQESFHPNAIDLGLDRVRAVAQSLNILAPFATVITVAGTNGKGSCVAAMAALLAAMGKTFGAYTSPHIQQYNERIQFNGVLATDAELCLAFDRIDKARGDISLTYFEFGTLAALLLFSQKELDFWLLEVGLGGRLDAINIIDPQLSIITSIDLDHMDWLGDTRESIGYEKAGICRKNTPLICTDFNPPASVLDVSSQLDCPLSLITQNFGFDELDSDGRCLRFWGGGYTLDITQLGLPPTSVAAAIQAMHVFGLLASSTVDITNVLSGLRLQGRLQEFRLGGKTIVLDVAHNPAAMQHLSHQLHTRYSGWNVTLVLAMMKDKNISESIDALKNSVDLWCVTTIEDLPRAAKASDIAQCLSQIVPDANVCIYPNVSQALRAAIASPIQSSSNLILVAGSFYCVSEAMLYIDSQA